MNNYRQRCEVNSQVEASAGRLTEVGRLGGRGGGTLTARQRPSTRPAGDDAPGAAEPLSLVPVRCCICEADDAEPVAVGEDFEYRTSPDTFLAVRCRGCGLVYLNPRPSTDDLSRIYPPTYHAFEFSPERFGLVYRVRRRLEARRLLAWCRGLGKDARILDVGCGDGFHLRLLRDFGAPGWKLEGVDLDGRAVESAARAGIKIHQGRVEQLGLPEAAYDVVLLVQTIEHVEDPPGVLRAVRSLLKPGGRVVIVTDNTGSPDFRLFKRRYWGGYHFPRHWNLFDARTLRALATKVGMEVDSLATIVSPVNWVYSVRNSLADLGAPPWVYNNFSLEAAGALAVFTAFDASLQLAGRGALVRAILRRAG